MTTETCFRKFLTIKSIFSTGTVDGRFSISEAPLKQALLMQHKISLKWTFKQRCPQCRPNSFHMMADAGNNEHKYRFYDIWINKTPKGCTVQPTCYSKTFYCRQAKSITKIMLKDALTSENFVHWFTCLYRKNDKRKMRSTRRFPLGLAKKYYTLQ